MLYRNFRNCIVKGMILGRKTVWYETRLIFSKTILNPLTPNDPYRGRTAPLTYKAAFYVFIQQI